MEERIDRAVELFKSGYNCSQSVVTAFADLYVNLATVSITFLAGFKTSFSASLKIKLLIYRDIFQI